MNLENAKLLEGKKGLIFGVANQKSIAWGISQAAHAAGAKLGFTYLNETMEKRVRPLAEGLGSELVVQCDVTKNDELDATFEAVEKQWGEVDFLVHSLAFANAEDLKGRFHETSRDGFKLALEISAYSLIELTRRVRPFMKNGGSIITLTYLGAERVVPNYRLMGVAKAALEASTRELAVDLGGEHIRVNAISAGPIKTLAASGIASFKTLVGAFEERAPLKKPLTQDDVGNSALYLLSDLSSAITGEVLHVDCGFSTTA